LRDERGDVTGLELDPEAMRQLGYRTVDWLVDQLEAARTQPVLTTPDPADMQAALARPAPTAPVAFEDLLATLATDVLPNRALWGHPRFFAYVPGSSSWPSALGDFIASAANLDASTWREAAGLVQLELAVIDWFRDWVGYPPEASGILTSGGSVANLTAIACAREIRLGAMSPDAVVYVSDQTHSSLAKGARVLGFRPDQVRVLPTDRSFRLRPEAVAAAIEADRARGLEPLAVCAAAGSTSTGAVDPLAELAAVAHEVGLWLHVDAAYGGFAAITARGRTLLAGIEAADSITLDPHKWLYQPFECGATLVRDGRHLGDAFRITPHYLKDAEESEGRVNLSNRGIQLTRGSRALKVWLSVSFFGLDTYREVVDRCLDLTDHLRDRIAADDRFELLARGELGVVCFRRVFDDTADEAEIEARNSAVVRQLAAAGDALVSSTRLNGRYAIRMCVLNHTTTLADVDATLDLIGAMEPAPTAAAPVGAPNRRGERMALAWATGDMDHPVLHLLSDGDREMVLDQSQRRRIDASADIIVQWDDTHEMYLLLDGAVRVTRDDRAVTDLGAGDFFGELATVEWGAGYRYPRLASVTAIDDVDLLVVPSAVVNRLAANVPDLARLIEQTAYERLASLPDPVEP
jgi:glutamate/tyrosine decarboxylase-like PLP-dependent enzyme